jgi:hypothetical protein
MSAAIPPAAPPTMAPKWGVVEEEPPAVPAVWVADAMLVVLLVVLPVVLLVVDVLVDEIELVVNGGLDEVKGIKDADGESVANAP